MSIGTTAASVLDFAQHQVDRLMPPTSREKAYVRTKEFATARPMLFSFIAAQIAFSTLPVLCFSAFVFSVLFAFSTVFLAASLFWICIALCVLIPILVLTSSVALFAWAFGASTFILGRWSYTVLCDIIANSNPDLGNSQRKEARMHPNLVSPAASSASTSPTSWARVEGQQAEHRDDKSEGQPMELAHPDPGSDVDALEP
ncbi:hypothetical protein VTI28DRAFT_3103 [Corynascus sepedonium]